MTATLEQIIQDVKENEVSTYSMADIRDAMGNRRLGRNVRNGIARTLEENGIGSYPELLPDRQTALVRLYKREGNFSKLLDVFTTLDADSDDILRALLKKNPKKASEEKANGDK